MIGRTARREGACAHAESLWPELAGPAGLTRRSAAFSRRDVIQALCERLPAELVAESRLLEREADAFIGSDHVMPLIPGDNSAGGELPSP